MTSNDPIVYGGYTQAELDAQYDQTTLVPDLAPYFSSYEAKSAKTRERFEHVSDVAYGPSPDERLDIFPAQGAAAGGAGAPVSVFLHGGAWTRLTKEHSHFPADLLVPAGACLVVPEFAMAPRVTMDEIVRQVRAAYAWVHAHIAEYGGNPTRIFASGHSSGAHLTAMVLAGGWREAAGLPPHLIKGGVLVSGPYDLEPVRLSKRNEYLHLDEAEAYRNTPAHHLGADTPPLYVGWGDGDLPEFKRVSRAFADACEAKGIAVTREEYPGCNHFDTFDAFADPGHPLGRALLAQMGLG